MATTDMLPTILYLVDSKGEKTDVLIPLETWRVLVASWKQLAESLEDREDIGIFKEWLEKRNTDKADMMSLEAFEQELEADGLLSS